MAKGQNSGSESKSELKTGAERFLALAMTHALDDGWRSAEDFLRHFKPQDIMAGLEKAPDLRATLLVQGAGVHEKIARKKSTSSAAEDLRIALDEKITTPAEILALFPADDRVRYLDKARLWSFVTEDQFWKGEGKRDRAIDRMLFLVQLGLDQELVKLQDVADGMTFEIIAARLPQAELTKVVLHALQTGRKKTPLTEQSLLEVVPLRDLLSYVPLDQTWKGVILAKVAQPSGFISGDDNWDSSASGATKETPKASEPAKQEAKAEPKGAEPEPESEPEVKAPEPPRDSVSAAAPMKPPPKPSRAPMKSEDDEPADEVDNLIHSTRSAPEEEARRRVADRLRAINRLPPGYDSLSTPILLSIESMYADLLTASTDESREMCIRESFPNEQQLTTALLALIALLDPSIDVNDPVIKEADVDSLIKVVLFEERHRYELAHPSARPPSPPPPPAGGKRSVAPPPLPRSGAPLPPPLPDKR